MLSSHQSLEAAIKVTDRVRVRDRVRGTTVRDRVRITRVRDRVRGRDRDCRSERNTIL